MVGPSVVRTLSSPALLAGAALFTSAAAIAVLRPKSITCNVPSSATSEVTTEAERTSSEECDCAPLWDCMVKGGECSALEADLKACMARSSAQPKLPK